MNRVFPLLNISCVAICHSTMIWHPLTSSATWLSECLVLSSSLSFISVCVIFSWFIFIHGCFTNLQIPEYRSLLGGFPCSPTSESEGMWLPNTSPKSFIICHDLSHVFISFHHSPSLLIFSIILHHLASSCMTLYHAYHILSSGFIHLLPITSGTLYIVLSIFHLQSPTNNDATSTQETRCKPHGHLHAKTKTAQLHCMTFCSGFRKRNLPLCSPLHLGSRRMLMSNAKSGVMSAQHSMSYASQQTNINHFTLNSHSWSTMTKFCKQCKTCGCPRQELRQHLKHIPQERWDRCLAGLLLQSNPPRKM